MTADNTTQMVADMTMQNGVEQITRDAEYLYKELTYKIRGACYEVYNILGPGFKEDIYHRALSKELKTRQLPCIEKARLKVAYKGEQVGIYEPDFIVDDKVLIELKAVPSMPALYETQLYYYLKGSSYRLGFLVNFGANKLDIRRRIFDRVRISGHLRSHQRSSAS